MHTIEHLISESVKKSLADLYQAATEGMSIPVQRTRPEFAGDFTVVVFPFLQLSKKGPEPTAEDIGAYLHEKNPFVKGYNVVKGFLNIETTSSYWLHYLEKTVKNGRPGHHHAAAHPVMVEYSCPNTNKPLHLGHIRNNLIGYSISKILIAAGFKVIQVNLINDRVIHICKSMLAWQKWGNGETPGSAGKKGDHFVGDYYVLFDKKYKEEQKTLINGGLSEEEAGQKSELMKEARELLLKWEAGDKPTIALWERMNSWVYEGFDVTHKRLGVKFDKVYYESETYLLGKAVIKEGLEKGVFFKKPDGSVWIDLTADGLDEKLVLRADGTSVYITQDLGTAVQRAGEYRFGKLIYVVGNEQEYHFKVLFLILKKLGYEWAAGCHHLSYGMVELPEGKMKSREGTVVDADDLMDEMERTAEETTRELGKIENFDSAEAKLLYQTLGMGALKYFILKVDPKKKMLFNPRESVDFEGNTGPFVQYTHARICSLLSKAEAQGFGRGSGFISSDDLDISEKEKRLIIKLYEYDAVINDAARQYNPSLVAGYVYELAKEYNQFYHEFGVLREEDELLRAFRLALSHETAKMIRLALELLGMDAPAKM
ncbi:MAG: arginine--tRNA ligase [Bacteroidia bacterium]|nr:arginine--tRNA ligase [Bacteroidia bacterium]